MVAQNLAANKVDMGKRLMGPSFANEQGHFEDEGLVELHDALFNYNGEDWRFHKSETPHVLSESKALMREYIEQRQKDVDKTAVAYGAKDPRAVFFLNEWYEVSDGNIKFLLVYRDWQMSVSSLLKRHSRTLLQFNMPAQKRSVDFDFWRYPDLAAKMWLESARRMIECVSAVPNDSLLFEQSAFSQRNLDLQSIAEAKGIAPSILECKQFKPHLMQQSFSSTIVDMMSPAIIEECDAALIELRNAADLSYDVPAQPKTSPAFVNRLIDEQELNDNPNTDDALQLPESQPQVPNLQAFSISHAIAVLQDLSAEVLERVDWNTFLLKDGLTAGELVKLFHLALKANNQRAAEQFVFRAIAMRDIHWQWSQLGDMYFRSGQYSLARTSYNKAFQLAPEHPTVLAKKADMLIVDNALDEAEKVLRDASEKDASNMAIAQSFTRLENAKKALSNNESKSVTQQDVLAPVRHIEEILDAMSGDAVVGKALERYMIDCSFILRDNATWIRDALVNLTVSAQRCFVDSIYGHLRHAWSDPVLLNAFTSEKSQNTQDLNLDAAAFCQGTDVKDIKLGLHIHVFYAELVPEICSFTRHLPKNTHVVLTAPKHVYDVLNTLPLGDNVDCELVANQGRDIAPWLVHASALLNDCDVVLKLHTKATPHSQALRNWRLQLLWNLLGDSQCIYGIIQRFQQQPDLGLLMPQYHPHLANDINWGKNFEIATEVAKRIGIETLPDETKCFPAGSMFWYRPKALSSLVCADWSMTDFPEEQGQIDGTPMHAIERLVGIVAINHGFKVDFINRKP